MSIVGPEKRENFEFLISLLYKRKLRQITRSVTLKFQKISNLTLRKARIEVEANVGFPID
jgi:hypothetical protein